MFVNPTNAENLRWHGNKRKCDGLLRHPTNFVQWNNIDKEIPTFKNESRNLRVGLATGGMNPFGNCTNHNYGKFC